MAGKISGLYVGVTAVGGVLVWSGWKGTTLAATFKSLLNGNLNAPASESITSGVGGGPGGSSTNVASGSENYITIAQYLVANGYSNAGAAGVVGCVAGESGGSPEAVEDKSDPGAEGEGLIQWTPGSSYGVPVTGNATADLDAQLPMIIAYNNAQGSNLVAMLNAITDPVQAADFYSQYFERPQVTDSDVVASVATSVYNELQSGTAGNTGLSGTTAKEEGTL